MLLKEKISIENFEDKKFKIRLIESKKDTEAAFTHYLHNHRNGVSQFYKPDAIEHVKNLFKYKFPEEKISNTVAEEALQYLIFQQENIPFPAPKNPDFKFIDLFAGIGGFRLYSRPAYLRVIDKGVPPQKNLT
ncbi:hypothetical protein [uncultured Kordia sp.]|uniref:hypothetical protein n=1 Tax=uncultured Kordia sp. TaxID=507699 RepID=UPI00261A0640|nr:hypothetical protein [uncultured Kordia sp.]